MAPAAPGRACSKQTCNRDAVCTLTYVYADSTAVIGPLSARREPHAYDLCPVHADALTAPRGWRVVRLESAADWEDPDPSAPSTAEEATDGSHGAASGTARGVRVLRDVSYRGPREPETVAPENAVPGEDAPSEPAAAGGVERVGGSEYPGPTHSIANANTPSEPLPRSVPLPDELRTPHWRRP